MVKIGLIYKQLVSRDFRVLSTIEKFIGKYEHVPYELIERRSKLPDTHLYLALAKLHRLGLVKRATISGRRAFRLTYLGLDMLALRALVARNVLEAIGDRIGVGKESDVYDGLAPGGGRVIVKFLRIGRTSFRKTRISRSWTEDPRHTWFHQSKIAAEREYAALKEIYGVGGSVPYPLGHNRHVVVIEHVSGVELYTRPRLRDPEAVLRAILDTIRKAYVDVGIVHGDLSEYNVIVDLDLNKPYIIDWPQYVYRDQPSADALLERDVKYIIRFFSKNYGLEVDASSAIEYVRGRHGS